MNTIQQYVESKECTGCFACADICPSNAIQGQYIDDALYPIIDNASCTQCGLCTKVCPAKKDYVYERENAEVQTFAAWSTDVALRKAGASGGVFGAIAKTFIQNGGEVYGATIDQLRIKHTSINQIEDIPLLQNSKYQQGDLTGIYKEICKKLENKKSVLFSGTPCQVAALLSYLNCKKVTGDLITVDFICGGFPTEKPLKLFLQTCKESVQSICSFRNKNHGWKPQGYKYEFIGSSGNLVGRFFDVLCSEPRQRLVTWGEKSQLIVRIK
ncbi:4Fe-4S dicluster domain-containing protein [Oligosphaera ethanolica]|uniref:Coenzyme F420-reducing hydrogenase beta subunit n=1 Tax=Oligosphaera ethanolica TaxID=760260 RepID=A0AAE3VG12_9BACT|nr:4Fe-4S dicluster domain-containing protein [Oligosphaera ethanolica]MDQ0289859.1 coenzyme F420-reducing hydrogenase beta subunit [Oligosphaera ethanolica]